MTTLLVGGDRAPQWRAWVTAEWLKLRTVRSTTITLAIAFVVAIGFGALACDRYAVHLAELAGTAKRAEFVTGFDATSQSLVGNAIAQLAIGVLGVLVVTSEFATGMVRASLAAMPLRRGWIAAKLAVFTAVALVVGQLLTFTSFFVGQAILGTQHVGVSIADTSALGSVVATGLYLTLIGMLGVGLGLVIRHTAGALSTLLALLFMLPVLAAPLPQPLQWHITRFFPEIIGEQASTATPLAEHFPIWGGIGLIVAYVAATVGLGAALLSRRDA
jgi:ABC-2 type transport system permease protein